jgi:hypothetical protein
MKTLLDVFTSSTELAELLHDFNERARVLVGPMVTPNVGTHVDAAVLDLSRLWLRQTVDDQYGRGQLFQQAMSKVSDRLNERSITNLGFQGLQFEVQRNVMIVGFNLVAKIWH